MDKGTHRAGMVNSSSEDITGKQPALTRGRLSSALLFLSTTFKGLV